ncbi:GNAT family N-acetyltransferase [Stappia sp.]|uniref:GNAT family N-acetyltransferase n=1 Tax=Stappia sp. TaxID=1870903 RepID=UPI003A993372
MSLLRAFATTETARILRGGEGETAVHLRAPQPHDFPEWAALREESRAFLQPWEPQWAEDELTRAAYRRRLRRYAREIREDRAYPFFLFREEDGALVGGATLSNIRRGVAQACSLGYWMGATHAGRGYMSEAVRALLSFAFGELALHRVEAACLPHNAASQRLLEKAGFSREGYARHYLRIAGKWQDHLLFARLSSDMASGDIVADIQPRQSPVWRVQAGVLAGEKEIL